MHHVWVLTLLACAPHGGPCFPLAAKPDFMSRASCELALPRVPAKDHPRCEQMSGRLALKLAEGPIVQGKRPAIRP
jgi:hypothetical protein